MRLSLALPSALLVLLSACSDPATTDPDAGGERPACSSDVECADDRWCDGDELCRPGDPSADARGCVASAPRCADCDEASDLCVTGCIDEDGDGVPAASCGGTDCDDDDRRRFPGATETCDLEHVDEDCDPATIGVRDVDGDGYASAECCNGALCGVDCDDARPGTHPDVPEVCDGLDNDCDTAIDEGVQRSAYRDADGDGHGDPTMPVTAGCGDTEGLSGDALDCDDADPAIRPGAAELCNGRDDNCDGSFDVDVDRDGHLPAHAVCLADVLPRDDCNDFDRSIHPAAPELCDLRDNDCDDLADERADADLACRSGDVHGAFCSAGACTVTACAPGRADCDGVSATGCETSIDDDPAHCGACGERCAFGSACVAGSCEAVAAIAVDAGRSHTCFVSDRGRVGCFGDNSGGRLGDGTRVRRPHAVEVPGIVDAVDVEVGYLLSCALRSDGSVVCWGGDATRPAVRAGLPTTTSLELSDTRRWNCGTAPDGEVWCWGVQNIDGLSPPEPHAVGVGGAAEVATSMRHTCVRDVGGGARCWGMNQRGVLGDGLTSHGTLCTWRDNVGPVTHAEIGDCSAAPVVVQGLTGLRGITVGETHSCARDDRRVWCWGAREALDGASDRAAPHLMLDVGSSHTVSALDAGLAFSCAVRSDGQAVCWGTGTAGQLGDGTSTSRSVPTPVAGVSLVDVSAGSGHACGIDPQGSLVCWGANSSGQLGDRTSTTRPRPGRVAGIDPATVVVGSQSDACARTRSGQVLCWGASRAAMEPVAGLEGVVELAGRGGRMCARTGAGAVSCWAPRATAEAIAIPPARAIAVGGGHACAALLDGTVRCWGANDRGQLGDGTTTASSTPVVATGVSDVVELALGSRHSCARRGDGQVRCWGSNELGQLGDGTGAPAGGAVAVSGIADAVQLVAGAAHTCVRHLGGRVSCWGDDASLQLGDGPSVSVGVAPRAALGVSGVSALAAGAQHTCALLWSGEVLCWGANYLGQSGQPDEATDDVPIAAPTRVPGLTARALGAGDALTCAIDVDQRTLCWGSNMSGQIGDGGSAQCTIVCTGEGCDPGDCDRETPTVVAGI